MFLLMKSTRCSLQLDIVLHSCILMFYAQQSKVNAKQTSVEDQAVFRVVWSCLNRVVSISQSPGGTNSSPLNENRLFWRGMHLPVLSG